MHDDTLKGIQGVGAVVENLRSDIEAAGLHGADVRTDVELKLRVAGIKVLTNGEALKQPGFPQLYVNISIMVGQGPISGIAAYNLSVALKQGVILATDSSINTWTSTWQSDAVGYSGAGMLPKLRDNIKDMVDKFINAQTIGAAPAATAPSVRRILTAGAASIRPFERCRWRIRGYVF